MARAVVESYSPACPSLRTYRAEFSTYLPLSLVEGTYTYVLIRGQFNGPLMRLTVRRPRRDFPAFRGEWQNVRLLVRML
ncbi:hypothetical protein TSAR_011911 [Trichomalopsis sarcophagae]|uniref:Uncharacterized protein n=1 Tax=Trichomalopsis sarcophagae TaxID=543379 RepID=A0A232F363_9HYME|nr:hypothetical protein TSAR_011911 [Trichomalopsis sarcophagae]